MEDIYQCIFQYLPITDIITCKLVSKTFHKIIKQEILWKNVHNVNFSHINIFKTNYYETCKLHILLQKLSIKIKYDKLYTDLYESQYIGDNSFSSYIVEIQKLKKLKHSVVDSNIETIPKEFGILDNLLCINLRRSRQITFIPIELTQLNNLQILYLSNNKITQIPTELGKLNNLIILVLRGMKITQIPTELGELSNLQKLYLNDNELVQIPTELGQLNNLKDLHLHNNRIAQIPTEFGKLNNLNVLELGNNRITEIPREFECLTNLVTLRLYKNQITSIPKEFKYRPLNFNLFDNPI